jgi:hypothetical protein
MHLCPKNGKNDLKYDNGAQKISKYLTKMPKNGNLLGSLQSYFVLNKYL